MRPGRNSTRTRAWAIRLAPHAAYIALALWVTGRLWRDPDGRTLNAVSGDHTQFQWMFQYAVRVVTKGANPFFTDLLNAPNGVSLVANTSCLGLAIPAVPITMLWGPQVSVVIVLTLGLALTASGWWYVLRNRLGFSRPAATLGGAFCGFAPGMISHTNGHVNWAAMFLVPFLVLAAIRLTEPHGSVVRGGVRLGLLAIWQAFINEEVLLYTALAVAVFLLAYGLADVRQLRTAFPRVVKGLAIAGALGFAALAYPLYLQFFGPQSYHGLPPGIPAFRGDFSAAAAFPTLSLGGDIDLARRFSWNLTEQNTFYGWPLLLLAFAVLIWKWHSLLVRSLTATAVLFFALSLGDHLLLSTVDTGIPMPWKYLQGLPLLEHVVPTRFGLVLIPCLGVLIAIGVDAARSLPAQAVGAPVRKLAVGLVVAVLIPLIPMPVTTNNALAVPAFIRTGKWQTLVPQGRSVVMLPLTADDDPTAMFWFARTGQPIRIAGGYFIGPDEYGDAIFGAPPRPTTLLVRAVADSGVVPPVTAQMRADLQADLRYWKAAIVILPGQARHAAALRELMGKLLSGTQYSVTMPDDLTVWELSTS